MSKFLFYMVVINAAAMLINLAIYSWGSHAPSFLAIGIANGFAMLLCANQEKL